MLFCILYQYVRLHELNNFGQKRAIRVSLIFHFVIPYIALWDFRTGAEEKFFLALKSYSIEVSPSLTAYLVRSAMLCRSSFFIICLR